MACQHLFWFVLEETSHLLKHHIPGEGGVQVTGVNTEHPFLFPTFLLLVSQLCFKGLLVKSWLLFAYFSLSLSSACGTSSQHIYLKEFNYFGGGREYNGVSKCKSITSPDTRLKKTQLFIMNKNMVCLELFRDGQLKGFFSKETLFKHDGCLTMS